VSPGRRISAFLSPGTCQRNLVFAASAEEEISGVNGIELVLLILARSISASWRANRSEMAVAEEA